MPRGVRLLLDAIIVALWLGGCGAAIASAVTSHFGPSLDWGVVAAVLVANAILLFLLTSD
jgi:hypothetical protein